MHWRIAELPEESRERLAETWRTRGESLRLCYFTPRHRPRLLLALLFAAALVATGLVAVLLGTGIPEGERLARGIVLGLAVLACGWTLALFVELVRAAGSAVKPFLVLTSSCLVRCGYDHGWLEAYRLEDATAYKSVDRYGSDQKFSGRQFQFTFPEGEVTFTARAREAIAGVESIVASAKAKERSPAGAALVPKDGGVARVPLLRQFSDPFGAFWILLGGLLGLALVVGLLVARSCR